MTSSVKVSLTLYVSLTYKMRDGGFGKDERQDVREREREREREMLTKIIGSLVNPA